MGRKRIAHRTWNPPPNNHREEPPRSPPNYYSKVNTQEVLQNSELPLEEKFCLLAGIPWYEVVAAQNHIYCHENVLKWDDSAAKDALFDAQERFCSMINGLPCEHPLPDPDMYIDKINWNRKIDPGLISNMDKEYCNSDEEENSANNKISGSDDKNKITVDHRLEDNVDVKDLAQGWNKCGDLLESKSAMNSWEQNGPNGDEATKDNKWGSSVNKPSDWNKGLNDARESTKYKSDALKNPGAPNCWNSKPSELSNQNNDIEKINSGMRTRACRKREEYQASHKSQKHEDADSESPQFRGNGRPRRRYNLRSSKY